MDNTPFKVFYTSDITGRLDGVLHRFAVCLCSTDLKTKMITGMNI